MGSIVSALKGSGGVMEINGKKTNIITGIGLAVTLLGTLDPLEGSVLILSGVGMAALGAKLAGSPQQKRLYWAFSLAAVGVTALFWLSALGGVGGNTGRSNWWLILVAPYPAGWLLGIVGAIKKLREVR